MRSYAVHSDESVVDELRGRGRSGICERAGMVQEVFVVIATNCPMVAIRHVLWHLQRVHRDHRHEFPTDVRIPRNA